MGENIEILEVSKIYDVEYTCPKCKKFACDKLIDCLKAKCCHCGYIVELDQFELDGRC